MNKKELMVTIEELKEKYNDLIDKINIKKANGDLGKLINLREEFDETFDTFFDNKELRVKYNAWDFEEDCIDLDKSNADLLELLDEEDLQQYIEFFKDYISRLEDELSELESDSI